MQSSEKLGRYVLSNTERKKAAKGKMPLGVFLEAPGINSISCDRLSIAPMDEAIQIAIKTASGRTPPKEFHGWAVVRVSKVIEEGCSAVATEEMGNPYHADIVLPDPVIEDRDRQKQYAAKLAKVACWKPRDTG